MKRPSASIVILAWNGWEVTKACLDSLRPTLSVRDEVIVVDNGSIDRTPVGLKQYRWAKVISNAENRGFAGGCNQGAAVATKDVVVYLNNDTVLAGHWLDELLAPFADPEVGATGPRSNFVSGPQLVAHPSYLGQERSALREYVRAWTKEHRGQTTDCTRLVGFCLAVRRSLVEEIGGFDEGFAIGGCEDDDLCDRIVASGHRLLIAHGSFVHHEGHKTFDANGVDWQATEVANHERLRSKRGLLLSACLIVKDEERALPRCLRSLSDLVDEVVVYDTGSSDRTVEVARANGARVIEGYWDDDFGRARNAALAECHGRWILHVDADEEIVADARTVRTALERAALPDGLLVTIENLDEVGRIAVRHRAVRLFRRERCHWSGRLHEQVVNRVGPPLVASTNFDILAIRHYGYVQDAIERGDKVERNVRIAAREAEEGDGWNAAFTVLSLGRSLLLAGRLDEALDAAQQGRASATEATVRHGVLRLGCEVLLAMGRSEDVPEWAAELRTAGEAGPADYFEALARLQMGQAAEAAALLEGCVTGWDASNQEINAEAILAGRIAALAAAGEHLKAAELGYDALREDPSRPLWGAVASCYRRAGASLAPIVNAVPEAERNKVFAQIIAADPASAAAFAEAWWERWPASAAAVALATHVGRRLAPTDALVWSMRLRATGFAEHCPLVARARRSDLPAQDRIVAAATAFAGFGDERAAALVADAAPALDEDQVNPVLEQLGALAPSLVEPFVAAFGAAAP